MPKKVLAPVTSSSSEEEIQPELPLKQKGNKAKKPSKKAPKNEELEQDSLPEEVQETNSNPDTSKIAFKDLIGDIKKALDKDNFTKVSNIFEKYNLKEYITSNNKNKRNKKDPNAKKKEPTLYNRFCTIMMKTMDSKLSQSEKMKAVGQLWSEEYKNNQEKLNEFKAQNNL